RELAARGDEPGSAGKGRLLRLRFHRERETDRGVGLDLEQVLVLLGDPPQQLVQEPPAVRARMARNLASQFHEPARDTKLRSDRRRGAGLKLCRGSLLPFDLRGRDPSVQQPAGGGPPALEVRFNLDPSHGGLKYSSAWPRTNIYHLSLSNL